MKSLFAQKKKFFPDDIYIWLCGIGLAIGIVMIVGLLTLVVVNGARVFWPHPILQVSTASGQTYAGSVVKDQINSHTGKKEIQLYTANRDVSGYSFKYLDEDQILSKEYPSKMMHIERVEYGDVIARALRIEGKSIKPIEASDDIFKESLDSIIREVAQKRRQIKLLETRDIGRVNSELESIRLKLKTQAKASNFLKSQEDLEQKFQLLAARAQSLRASLRDYQLIVELPDKSTKTIIAGQIVHYHYPNSQTFIQKLRFAIRKFYLFLSTEPREANTEGGIFPAIFGTFVMTLLMSVAVTPFGVLAAIYLREYASQGFFVRMVRIAVNNLAGVPSIVFGVFGLGFFVYFVGGSIDQLFFRDKLPTPTFGTGGILWAALTLALMTVPVVIVATEEALAAVPRGVREGSLALGASKWQTIQKTVLPASAPGILTGLILAMARGAGEVAPLMLVGVVKLAPTLPLDMTWPFFHLDRKFMHLGFHIYDLGFQSPDSEAAKPMVYATTFLLILLVVALNLSAILIRNHLRKKYASNTF